MWIANVLILAAMFIGFVGDDVHAQETFSVQIDIDIRSSENTITIGKKSIVSVAIISTDGFNVAKRIDLESLMLGAYWQSWLGAVPVILRALKVMLTKMVNTTWYASSTQENSTLNPASR